MTLATFADKYVNQLRRWVKPLFVEKEPILTTERYCLFIGSHHIHLLGVDKTPTNNILLSNSSLEYDDVKNIPLILTGLIERISLTNTPIYWLLSPEDYQLSLIESLPVQQNELFGAIKWRARSLINYPIDEAVIDYFNLPPPKKSATSNMIATVIARKATLSVMIDTLKSCQAKLSVIDIPELAMRNLTALYEDDEKSTAFIYFADNTIILNITREKTLFFTRRLALDSAKEITQANYEQLCLEILRYFDYYQSQWRHPSPTRIFVSARHLDDAKLATKLSELMLLTINPFKIKKLEGNQADLQSLEKNNLLSFGCVLREDGMHAKTGN